MPKSTVVQYETRPDAATANERLVERVYEELEEVRPSGLGYATLRLADGVGFLHIAVVDRADDPLAGIVAFAEFLRGIGDRTVAAPVVTGAELIASYGLLGGQGQGRVLGARRAV